MHEVIDKLGLMSPCGVCVSGEYVYITDWDCPECDRLRVEHCSDGEVIMHAHQDPESNQQRD